MQLRFFRLAFAVVAFAGLLGNASRVSAAADVPLFDDPVVAKGKGFEIHQSELDDSVTALKATLASQNQGIAPQDEPALRASLLDRMVLTRILVQRATDEDKAKAKQLADKFIADTKKKAPSEESYRRQLIATGLKPEVFEARALEQATVEKVVEREVKSKLSVSDQQIRDLYDQGIDIKARELEATIKKLETAGNQDTAFYRDGTNRLAQIEKINLARLERPEQLKAQVILLYTIDPVTRAKLSEQATKAKQAVAEAAVKKLRDGGDFTKLARQISEDPDVGKTGGEYTVTANTSMAPELLDALFKLPLNTVSDPIATRFGLYIARVTERIPGGKVPFDEVKDDLREFLLGQLVEQQMPAYAERLKKEYNVELTPGDAAK